MSISKNKRKSKIEEKEISKIHIFSYVVFNDSISFLLPRLRPLENNIMKSMMPIPFEVYVSSMLLFSIVGGFAGTVAGLGIRSILEIQPQIVDIFLPVILGGGTGAATFFILQTLPALKVKNRETRLNEEISHFIGYMSTLAASGLTLEGIFKSIAKEETDEEIVKDSRLITRNIEILGMDLISAVEDLIKRTPSGSYSEVLEGAIITVQAGGNLKEYFDSTARMQLEEKKRVMKKTTESLGVVAEIYTILLIVFPLLAVIMLSIMAILSPSLAGFDLITLMNILTFAVIPLSGIIMLIMMDTMVPKR